MRRGNFSLAKKSIESLNIKKGFYEEVRRIVGYYDNVEWEDWEIKRFQRVADYRYLQLLEGRK